MWCLKQPTLDRNPKESPEPHCITWASEMEELAKDFPDEGIIVTARWFKA